MRLACQPIARRVNQEDEVDGRFFAKRFECQRLESLADILSCSIYVDWERDPSRRRGNSGDVAFYLGVRPHSSSLANDAGR